MTRFFRRPYMVEAYRQFPGGVTDPWHSTHRTLEEAREKVQQEELDGAIAMVYRRTYDGDFEEMGNE